MNEPDRLLELTAKLMCAWRGLDWDERDDSNKDKLLEAVADTPEWIDLMAFHDGVVEYRFRPIPQHVATLMALLTEKGVGRNDPAWDSLEAILRRVYSDDPDMAVCNNHSTHDDEELKCGYPECHRPAGWLRKGEENVV